MRLVRYLPVTGVLVFALLGGSCDSSNPVAPLPPEEQAPPPTDSGGSVPAAEQFSVIVVTDKTKLVAGSDDTAAVTVRVRDASGSPPDDGEATVNTDLGSFLDDAGKFVKTVSRDLDSQGNAAFTFSPGDQPGTANLLASFTSGETGSATIDVIDPGDPPEADFEVEVRGFTASFSDKSTGNVETYAWDFGIETCSADTCDPDVAKCDAGACVNRDPKEANPTFEYSEPGSYLVQLTVSNTTGVHDPSSKKTFVDVMPDPPKADFDFDADGLRVLFTDTSENTTSKTTWAWTFESGQPATHDGQNPPLVTFPESGSYVVGLQVTTEVGTSQKQKFVEVEGEPIEAAFEFEVFPARRVFFTDKSKGDVVGWRWDFGDGSPIDTAQSPSHTYGSAKEYTVELEVRDSAGNTDRTRQVVQVLDDRPVADFRRGLRGGCRVQFTDESSGPPVEWSWSSDDSFSSTDPNPLHDFKDPVTVRVTLKVTNDLGSDSCSQTLTLVPDAASPPSCMGISVTDSTCP